MHAQCRGPVADAVFADLEPRIDEAGRRRAHAGPRPPSSSATTAPARGYVAHEERRRGARLRVAPRRSCPRTPPRPTCSPRSARFNDDPRVDAMLVQHPTPPQIDYEAALLEMDPDKDVDGLHPVNMGRLALGDAGPGAVHARGHRGAARALRDPGVGPRGRDPRPRLHARPSAGAAALAEAPHRQRRGDRRAHRRARTGPSTPAGPTSSSPRRACPASCSPSTSRPGAVVIGGGVRYEGRSCSPTSTRRATRWSRCN